MFNSFCATMDIAQRIQTDKAFAIEVILVRRMNSWLVSVFLMGLVTNMKMFFEQA